MDTIYSKQHESYVVPTGLKRFRLSKVRTPIKRLVRTARQYELDQGRAIDFDLVREIFAPRLAEHGVLATDTACLGAYLNHMGVYDEFHLGEFGQSQASSTVLQQAFRPTETEFAAYDKIALYKKLEDAIDNPREAHFLIEHLLTHDTENKTGERRLVQRSFAGLIVGVLKGVIDGLDFATLTYSYQYLDMKHQGIRRSLKSWNQIAQTLGEQYFCPKRKIMSPTSRFWEAVIWLKKKGVITSKAVTIKDRTGKYSAIPSFKAISKDFLLAVGFNEERLDELRKLSAERTTDRLKKRIETLTTDHFKPMQRLQAAARELQAYKEKGMKIARSIHSTLKIPVIHEFSLETDLFKPLKS